MIHDNGDLNELLAYILDLRYLGYLGNGMQAHFDTWPMGMMNIPVTLEYGKRKWMILHVLASLHDTVVWKKDSIES